MTTSLSDPTPFPAVWDNTMLATLTACQTKANIEFLHHQVPSGLTNVNLHAGGAFAKGIETARRAFYDDGLSQSDALLMGIRALTAAYGNFDPGDSPKTLNNLWLALASYCARYPFATDNFQPHITNGKAAVEFNFAWPIDVLHPETGEPIIYCGRFDLLAELNGNKNNLMGVDEKTSLQLGASWVNKWQLRSQFIGYTWGARKFGYPLRGFCIRGIGLLKYDTTHMESINYYPNHLIASWYADVCAKLEAFKVAWASRRFLHSYADACESYGGCPYRMLCQSPDPDSWLSTYYKTRVWTPLHVVD